MPSPSRWLRRLAGASVLLGLLAAAAWWGVPALLTSQLPPRLSQALGRPVTLTAVEFAPWDLALTVRGLRIGVAAEAAGAAASSPALLQIDRLHADIALASLRHGAPVIEALDVDGLQLHLTRTAAGRYDIDDLIQRVAALPKPAPGAEPARFSLNNVALRGAQIHFDDRPTGQVHRVQALTLTLPFLSNLPNHVDITTEPRLAFELNGTRFDSGTQALPFKASRTGALTLAFKNLDLKPSLAYLPAGLPVQLLGAKLSSDLSLRFALPPGGAPTVAVKGEVALRDVTLAEPGGAALAGWQALTLQLTDVQPLQRRIGLGLLKIDGAELQLSRDAGGQLNLQRVLAARAGAAPAPAPATAAAPAAAASAAAGPVAMPWTVTLASLQLDGAKIRWTDDAVRPQAALQVDALGLQVDGLRWPSPTPLPVKLQGQLRSQRDGAPVVGRFSVDGQVHPQAATLALQVHGFDLATLAPYLAQTLKPRLSGQFAAQASVDWAAEPAAWRVKLDHAGVKDLQLRDGTAPRAPALASLRQFSVQGMDLNLAARQLSIAQLQLVQPVAAVARDAEGQFSLQQWLATAPAAQPRPAARSAVPGPAAAGKPWHVTLRDLSVTGGQLQWRDAAVMNNEGTGPVQVDVSDLKLRLQGLVWPAQAVASTSLPRLQVAARIGSPATPDRAAAAGEIDWTGRFGLAPVQVDGRLLVKRFPVHLVVPYAGKPLPLHLLHADASYQGQVRAQATPAGWQVGTDGDAQLTELQLNSLAAPGRSPDGGTELLTWQSLSLQGLSLAMAPPARPQLVVREIALDDFFSRLQITEAGRFNLQDVAALPPVTGTAAAATAAASPAMALASPLAAAPAPAASAPGGERLAVEAGQAMDLDIGGIQLRNGRVDFSDQFIRPNYSAQLTELNGSIGRLRSGTREMASIALRGRAAGTALLDISGQLNPTAKPLALDIRARATDLELAPLSPYAGRYAGYGIERGKLSVDVSYKIDADGKLDAKNQVTLNQLTFGDQVDSPSATKLPVLLAVSLLTDRNGVIDINLPVTGSVNDPKFSVGGIIWQVIVNLLTKAVTAPFSLLAGGSGPDLSVVQFQPGTAQLADSGRQSLDKVASALTDRPALIMTVTGSADPVSERDATQRAALDARLQVERRRERLRDAPASAAATAAAPVVARAASSAASATTSAAAVAAPPAESPLTAEDRARLLKRLYQQTPLPDKPRNVLGLLRDLPPAEMEARLLAAMPVTEVTMRELALQRGLTVRDALIGSGLASERLFLAAPKLRSSTEGDAAWVPQVALTLSNR